MTGTGEMCRCGHKDWDHGGLGCAWCRDCHRFQRRILDEAPTTVQDGVSEAERREAYVTELFDDAAGEAAEFDVPRGEA